MTAQPLANVAFSFVSDYFPHETQVSRTLWEIAESGSLFSMLSYNRLMLKIEEADSLYNEATLYVFEACEEEKVSTPCPTCEGTEDNE